MSANASFDIRWHYDAPDTDLPFIEATIEEVDAIRQLTDALDEMSEKAAFSEFASSIVQPATL